jgi:PKD repeat protein
MVIAGSASATHFSGGEIYWECIGTNQFRIRLVVYRDCAGIEVDPSYNLQLTSPCGNRTLNVSTPGGVEISQLCDLELPNSTCNGGSLPGIQQYIYTGTITLPPCNSWTISWTNIYRNNAIVNLTNPGTREMYITGVLNSATAPCNDSPTFTNTAIPYVCMGYPVSYSYGAVDAEADSLSYSLIGARMVNGNPVPYVAPFTPLVPIPGLTIDPVSGLVNFTLNVQGNWVVVVLVTQYDANGNVIGTIMRDMQFVAYPCSNIPPDAATGLVTNLTGGAVQTGPRSIQVCESGNFCFDMVISDANVTNVLDAFSNVGLTLPGATFSFTGTNPITATVCWTAAANTSGFFPFIVNVDDGACPISAFQTYVYSIQVLPGLYATLIGEDEQCLGTGDGSLMTDVTVGLPPYTYAWSTGATTAGITAGAGSYSVVVSDDNGCVSQPLTGTIGTNGLPNEADAGPDLVGCIGAFPVQLSGTVVNATSGSWSGGTGTFSGTGLNPGYTPSAAEIAAGGVTLTLTSTGNSTCPPAQDQVFINIPNGFANTTVDAVDAVCFGTNTGSASVVPANPAFTYLWNDPAGQTTATASNLGAGTYTVTITDAFGCDTQLSANIGPVAALSIASLTATDEACLGNGDGTATVTVTGGTPPYSYLWSNGATTPSISATSGTYTVSITDANNCAPASGSITITPQGLPNVANAGPDLVGCLNAFPISIQGSVTNATGASWSGGNGTISGTGASIQYFPNTSEVIAGGVTLVLTTTGNNTCPPDQDSVFIALSNSFLTAGLSTTAPLCNGAQNGSIIYAPELGGLSYQWNDPAAQTTASASGLTAGTYSITVSDALGCDTTLSATLIDPPVLATTAVMSTDVTCNGGNNGAVQLTVTGGTPAYTVNWNSGGMGLTQANLSAGSYTATITDANGCAITATATIDQPQPLTLTAQVPDTVCVNAPVTLTAQAQGGSGNYVYTWVGLGSGPMLTAAFNLSQLVTVTVTDQLGCTSPAVQHPVTVLNLNTATFLAYGDTTVCPGGVATVGAVFGNYPGTSSLLWTPTGQVGTGPFTHPITGDQDLTVTVTDQCGNTRTDVVQLRLDVPPAIQLPPIIAEGCAPLSVQLPNLGLASGISYLWTLGNGQTSTAVAPTVIYQAGSYQVGLTVTTAVGCSSTAPSTGAVIAHLPPTAAFTASAWTADIDNAVIQFTDQSTGTISSHEWLFGDGGTSDAQNPSHQFLEVGTFEVELYVEDAYGCSDMASGTITINPVYDVTVPNAFTPNANGGGGGGWIPGDLSNDVFYPFARFVDEFRMRIFNRWGELIFESTDIRQGWDGYYRGQLSPQDVYVVQTWVQFVDGKEVVKLTDLTLFR